MKRNALYLLITLLISGLLIYSCSKTEITSTEEEGKVNIVQNTSQAFNSTYKAGPMLLNYKASITGSIITSSLEVKDESNKRSKNRVIKFSFDDKVPAYKLSLHEKVLLEAEALKDDFSTSEIKQIAQLFEVFGKQIVANEKIDNFSQLTQSLFFHNAILKTIERSSLQNEDCNCTPHPGFFVDKIPFWCQEDYFISPAKIVQLIDKSKLILNAT